MFIYSHGIKARFLNLNFFFSSTILLKHDYLLPVPVLPRAILFLLNWPHQHTQNIKKSRTTNFFHQKIIHAPLLESHLPSSEFSLTNDRRWRRPNPERTNLMHDPNPSFYLTQIQPIIHKPNPIPNLDSQPSP